MTYLCLDTLQGKVTPLLDKGLPNLLPISLVTRVSDIQLPSPVRSPSSISFCIPNCFFIIFS